MSASSFTCHSSVPDSALQAVSSFPVAIISASSDPIPISASSHSGESALKLTVATDSSKGTVLCCAVLCCAVLCCAVLCCAVLCCAVLCCAVLCCAVLCCTEHLQPPW